MIQLDQLDKMIKENLWEYEGTVIKSIGMTIESKGPLASIGDICTIHCKKKKTVLAEVVGFKEGNLILMPLGSVEGIGVGSRITTNRDSLSIQIDDRLLGNVVDWRGIPLQEENRKSYEDTVPLDQEVPNPLTRNRINEQLEMGIKSIDGMLSIGKGQRVGIFAGSGVGKSTLLGMIARNTKASINVIALIGERGREVREFIEKDLKEEGMKNSIIVVATSDQPALMRLKAAMTATAIAEYFREKGQDVVLMMDSLTRFAMAQREIGLAVGEPPVSRGYTPSVFAVMPKLLERAGNSEKGSITGLYTVLVDGDDFNEPITDTARGILDGHILLSRKLANKGHYPAIDVLGSISRVMTDITTKEHQIMAREIKKDMAIYKDAEDLISVGAYVKGSNPEIDHAIHNMPQINSFLCQSTEEKIGVGTTLLEMNQMVGER